MKPTIEEAIKDLNDIRVELDAMRRIKEDASWLSRRDDVDATFYHEIGNKIDRHIFQGIQVELKILKNYPQLL